jgi:hypothetical protein
MDRARLAATLIVMLQVLAACGPSSPDVDDNSRPKALRISPGVLVKDSIDARRDPIDWKDFSNYQDARVTVVFSFGDRFTPHGLQGEISLFDFDGSALQNQRVVPGTVDYKFTLDVRKDKDYFFRVEARKGKAGYLVETRTEPLDQCAACGPGTTCCPGSGTCCGRGQACREGACVAAACAPPCRRGEVCEAGRCEEACPGGCHKGKVCDASERRCVTAAPTEPKTEAPAKKGCPQCAAGQACNEETSRCESVATGITAAVISVVEEGSGIVIIINRGSQDGVRPGASGRVGGLSFTVRDVGATKCKAFIAAKPSQVPQKSRVTIDK